MFGTWFSTLTNGVIVLGLHGLAFMGGWLEQMSGFTESARLVTRRSGLEPDHAERGDLAARGV